MLVPESPPNQSDCTLYDSSNSVLGISIVVTRRHAQLKVVFLDKLCGVAFTLQVTLVGYQYCLAVLWGVLL